MTPKTAYALRLTALAAIRTALTAVKRADRAEAIALARAAKRLQSLGR